MTPTTSSRPRRRALLGRLAAGSVLFATAGVVTGAGTASAAPTPIECAGTTIFVAQGSPTRLYRLAISATASGLEGQFVQVGTSATTPTYNGISYNPADSFLYGVNAQRHLVRVGGNGEVADLGLLTALPTSMNNGAFLPDGRLAVRSNGGNLFLVDVGTVTATLRTLSGPNPATVDLTYADGYLWGVANDGTHRMVRIDPTTGVSNAFPLDLPAGLTDVAAGAAWTFGNGNLGFSDNDTGTVFQVRVTDPASAAPSFTITSQMAADPTNQNDGASCLGGPTDLGVVKAASVAGRPDGSAGLPGDPITWTLTVTNHGPSGSSGYTLSDTLPAGLTDAVTTTVGCAITGLQLGCNLGELLIGQSRDVVVTATIPDASGTDLVNTATIEGNEADPNPANDTSAATTHIAEVSAAADDDVVAERDVPVTFDPLENDTPPTGGGTFDPTSVRLIDGIGDPVTELEVPGEGTYTVDTTTGRITFVPETGFTGSATPVTYRVTDSLGEVVTATITVTVTEVAGVPLTTPAAAAAAVAVGLVVLAVRRRRTA